MTYGDLVTVVEAMVGGDHSCSGDSRRTGDQKDA